MQLKFSKTKKVIVARVGKIVKKLSSPPATYKKLDSDHTEVPDIENDNAANEALEARLMELIASAPPSFHGPVVVRLVPACPDLVCRHLNVNIRLQTSFQVPQPQMR